jgi:hypothetical protein
MSGRKWFSIEFSICSAYLLESSSHWGSGGTDRYSMSDSELLGSSFTLGVGGVLELSFTVRFLVGKGGFVLEGGVGLVVLDRFLSIKLAFVDVVLGDLAFFRFLV